MTNFERPLATQNHEPHWARRIATTAFATILAFTGINTVEERRATAEQAYEVDHTGGDGVWLHKTPGLGKGKDDLIKVLPEGAHIDVECTTLSTPVEGNPVWLRIQADGQKGHITDVYSSTKWSRNNTLQDQGIPTCEALDAKANENKPDNSATEYKTVFYAPGNGDTVYYGGQNVPMPVPEGTFVMAREGKKHPKWTDSTEACGVANANNFEDKIERTITALGGWSIGRLGPVYYLKNTNTKQREDINYVLLIDPGERREFEGNECDQRYDQSQLYADWLAEDKDNHLTILAGSVTADTDNSTERDGKTYQHAGIQNVIFPKIRDTRLSKQVLVCNYPTINHIDMYRNFRNYLSKDPITKGSQCPTDPTDNEKPTSWRP